MSLKPKQTVDSQKAVGEKKGKWELRLRGPEQRKEKNKGLHHRPFKWMENSSICVYSFISTTGYIALQSLTLT